jgi:CubicO group peptidase (beta-lactamase class C family)
LFQNDPLIYKPGTDREYSSLAFSLLCRILEKVTETDFCTLMKETCSDIGMFSTVLDVNDAIIHNRAR